VVTDVFLFLQRHSRCVLLLAVVDGMRCGSATRSEVVGCRCSSAQCVQRVAAPVRTVVGVVTA
jgi:hypothetical protein